MIIDRLITAIRQKEAFLRLERHLLKNARVFHRFGFNPENLSPSQVSAVNECIQTSGSLEDVKKAVSKYLNRQLEKLETQTSWLIKPASIESEESLGAILSEWVNKEKYLENSSEISDIDRLSVLRRFWSNVYGLYSYSKIFEKEDMPLREELLS